MKRYTYMSHLIIVLLFLGLMQTFAFDKTGVIKGEDLIPAQKIIDIDCQYFGPDMSLVFRLPYTICKEAHYKESYLFFFTKRVKQWIAIEGNTLSRLGPRGDVIWKNEDLYNHDFFFDPVLEYTHVIVNEYHEFSGTEYLFFRIDTLDKNGNLVNQWRAIDHLKELYKISKWKDIVGTLKAPLTARLNKRPTIVGANYISILQRDWQVSNGPLLPAGTMIVHIRYINALIALDPQSQIIWSYEFNSDPKDSVHTDIHTPVFASNGEIFVFHNVITTSQGVRSGVSVFDSSKPGQYRTIYLVPQLYAKQELEVGGTGSIQLMTDGSIFLSTGTEYGGVIWINKNGEEIFHWINPVLVEATSSEDLIPRVIYRARLVDKDILDGIVDKY